MLRRCTCGVGRFLSSAMELKGHHCKLQKKRLIPLMTKNHPESSWSLNILRHLSIKREPDKSDLSRFLIEIGTDPREARYWLNIFTAMSEASRLFTVIGVSDDVMDSPAQLENFASTVSFLYRNNMFPLIVYGVNKSQGSSFKETKERCVNSAIRLGNRLEQQGVLTRILFPGCGVIQGESTAAGHPDHADRQLRIKPAILESDFASQHLPILLSYGETWEGRMFTVDTWTLVSRLATLLQPLKVMLVNASGGFLDEQQKVIANINLPSDLETVELKKWRTPDKIDMMKKAYDLLSKLPQESSVVITSADTMLRELFSHRGSGTFFRCTEAVHKYTSFDGLDLDKLRVLLHRSFKKSLTETYFEDISPDVHAIYLSETYSGVAIVTKGDERVGGVPYLCKFAVTNRAQGQGIGELLWDSLRQGEPHLFWRAHNGNPINTWYFKKCEGSWNNRNWTVFWYGINDPALSSALISDALNRKDSFVVPEGSEPRQVSTVQSAVPLSHSFSAGSEQKGKPTVGPTAVERVHL